MHQHLADLDALAALPQCGLHGFPTSDHTDAAQAARKLNTTVCVACKEQRETVGTLPHTKWEAHQPQTWEAH